MTDEIQPDERALLQRARDGDDTAWPELLRPHESLLRARIRKLTRGGLQRRFSVADVLQETLITASDRVNDFEFRGEGSLRNWLVAIADRKARRAMQFHVNVRMRSLDREVTRAARLSTHQFQHGSPTPSAVVAARESEAIARRALAALKPDYQEILRLCREEALGFPEAAQRMGRSYEATKKLYGRALARFSMVLVEIKRETRER